MEPEFENEMPQEEKKYEPRPVWQIWTARIGLVIFLLIVVLYYALMFKG